MGETGLRALDALFRLRVPLDNQGTRLLVTAFDMVQYRETTGARVTSPTHHAITYEAVLVNADGSRETIWEKCQSWIGLPSHQTIDGDDAREGVLHSLSMKPGDTDPEFFQEWTDAQRDFGQRWGETIALISEERYGER